MLKKIFKTAYRAISFVIWEIIDLCYPKGDKEI